MHTFIGDNAKSSTEPKISWRGVSLVFLAPALGGFLYGFDIGATAFVLEKLNHGSCHRGNMCWWSDFVTRRLEQGLFVGAVSAGALLGSHLVLFHLGSSRISRRMELRVASLLYFTGALFNVLSGTALRHLRWGSSVLILGRLLFGVGLGLVMRKSCVSVICSEKSVVRSLGTDMRQPAHFSLNHPFRVHFRRCTNIHG